MNPFQMKPQAHGGKGGGYGFQQQFQGAPWMMPMQGGFQRNRPPPMKVYESQVIDWRSSQTDSSGRFQPLSESDGFEVVSIAYSLPGLKDQMKKERVCGALFKAFEDWPEAEARMQELAAVVPSAVDDNVWQKWIEGVSKLNQSLGVPPIETVEAMLKRRQTGERRERMTRASGSVLRELFTDDDVPAFVPGPIVGREIVGSDGRMGRVVGSELIDGAVQYKTAWADQEDAVVMMDEHEVRGLLRDVEMTPNPRPRRRARQD